MSTKSQMNCINSDQIRPVCHTRVKPGHQTPCPTVNKLSERATADQDLRKDDDLFLLHSISKDKLYEKEFLTNNFNNSNFI